MPGKSHGQRSLVGYSPWGHIESDMTEHLSTTRQQPHPKKNSGRTWDEQPVNRKAHWPILHSHLTHQRDIIWKQDLAWSVVWSHSRAETNRWTIQWMQSYFFVSKGFIIITAMIGNPHRICYWFHLLMGDLPERTSNVPSNLHFKKYAIAIYNKLLEMAPKLFPFFCAHTSAIWLGIISHQEYVSQPLESGHGYRTSFNQRRGLKSTCPSGLSLLLLWESWNCHKSRLSFGGTWPSELLTSKQYESRPF